MKKSKFLLLTTIILLSVQNTFAYNFYNKEISKVFPYKKNMELHIQNQYGNINIIPSLASSVTIDIKIKVEHYEQAKANSLLNKINISFSNYNNIAKAKTIISNLFKTGLKFSIDYTIRVPKDIRLNIKNKFGNISIEENINNLVILDIEYGDLFANKIQCQDTTSKHIIKLNYSKANIMDCDNVKLTANYSKVHIKKSKQLIVASKFTNLRVDSNTYIVASCHNDTYSINKTKSTNILKGIKSNIYIRKLQERAEVNLKKGEINITPEGVFKYIILSTQNVNTKINITHNIPYIFDINYSNSTISYPLNAEILSSKKDELNASYTLKGIYGNRRDISSSIKLKSSGGKIDIK